MSRDATAIAEAVRSGRTSATRVLEAALSRIANLDPALNAFVALDRERALAAADAIDRRVARGEDPGPLAGVPIGIKDNEAVAGMPTLPTGVFGSICMSAGCRPYTCSRTGRVTRVARSTSA